MGPWTLLIEPRPISATVPAHNTAWVLTLPAAKCKQTPSLSSECVSRLLTSIMVLQYERLAFQQAYSRLILRGFTHSRVYNV